MSRSFVVLMLGLFTALAPISIDMYLPALPDIGRALLGNPAQLQGTLSAFFLGFAGGQAIYGPISDRWGRKPPLYVGIGLFVLASCGCAMAANMEMLTTMRLLQAIGACAGGVIGRAIVRDLYPPEEAPRLYASLMLVMGVAPILAPLGGGWLAQNGDWRWIFWFSALMGGVCLLLLTFGLRETLPHKRGGGLGLATALLGYGRLLVERPFMACALAGGLGSAGMFCYISGSPTVLIEQYHIPADQFGWYFGSNALGLIATAQIASRLTRRIPARSMLIAAQLLQVILVAVLLLVAATQWGGLWGLLVPLFLFMACQGIVAPLATSLAMASQGRQAGLASSMLGTLQFSLSAIASSFVGVWHDGTALPMVSVMALTSMMGLIAHLLLSRQR